MHRRQGRAGSPLPRESSPWPCRTPLVLSSPGRGAARAALILPVHPLPSPSGGTGVSETRAIRDPVGSPVDRPHIVEPGTLLVCDLKTVHTRIHGAEGNPLQGIAHLHRFLPEDLIPDELFPRRIVGRRFPFEADHVPGPRYLEGGNGRLRDRSL